MTSGKLFLFVLVAALAACAVFVWPTIYYEKLETGPEGAVLQLRVNRWTQATQIRQETGEWIEYRPGTGIYDPASAVIEDGAHKVVQAEKEIRAMNEATKDAMKHSSPIK